MGITFSDPDVDTDQDIVQIAALTPADNAVIIGNGTAWVAESGATLKTSLGLTIGTDVLAYSANNASWGSVTRASGFDTFAATPTSANLAALITDEVGSTKLVFSAGTLAVASGKTLTASNTLTLTGTDGSTLAIGAGGTLASAAYVATGTTGATIPLLNGANAWGALQTHNAAIEIAYAATGISQTDAPLRIISTDAGASGPTVVLYHNSASPAANDLIRPFRAYFNDSNVAVQLMAGMNVTMVSPTAGAWTSRTSFFTGTAGAATTKLNIGNGIYTNGATGGDLGVDTINAGGVYDDNSLLTCYIVEAWKYGKIDLAKWDALTPNREHSAVYEEIDTGEKNEDDNPIMAQRLVSEAWTEVRQHAPARGFAKVAADRLDIDRFAQFVWDNERLPAFPAPDRWADMYAGKMSTGDLIQRLWETVEVMAIHSIEARKRELALIARVEALEAAQ